MRNRIIVLSCGFIFIIFIAISFIRASAQQVGSEPNINAPQAINLVPVIGNLASPVYVTNAHDGSNRLFIVEKAGRIRVLQPGASSTTTFLDISARVLSSGSEQGLLGLAFHPNYSTNRRFFVNYTRQTDGATVIAEYQVSVADPNVADTTETVILTYAQPFTNHKGGMLEFGTDGYLYIAAGDGGSANDPGNRAQNINVFLGKILRIDIDTPNGSTPYSSPATNPFFGATPGLDEIYAVGMRNPWRFSFDRGGSHQLYVADVGQGAREEIDIVTNGGNYGWRVYEGTQCTNLDAQLCTPGNYTMPIAEYSHTGGRCSITGGYVYRGTINTFPDGAYIYADYCSGEIFQLQGTTQTVILDTAFLLSSFGEDEAGEIYVIQYSSTSGTLYKITNTTSCSYSINPTSQTFSASGGSGSVTVNTTAGCMWSAMSNAAWLSITSSTSGTGPGSVNFNVAANTTTSQRQGTLTIAGQTFTVTQSGITCTYSLSNGSQNFTSGGGSGSFNVITQTACNWTASPNANWVSITSG
ncbi:MAG: PQQ-dependent sugar dehydrogenase, partial [Acidobacteriota bacterium]